MLTLVVVHVPVLLQGGVQLGQSRDGVTLQPVADALVGAFGFALRLRVHDTAADRSDASLGQPWFQRSDLAQSVLVERTRVVGEDGCGWPVLGEPGFERLAGTGERFTAQGWQECYADASAVIDDLKDRGLDRSGVSAAVMSG